VRASTTATNSRRLALVLLARCVQLPLTSIQCRTATSGHCSNLTSTAARQAPCAVTVFAPCLDADLASLSDSPYSNGPLACDGRPCHVLSSRSGSTLSACTPQAFAWWQASTAVDQPPWAEQHRGSFISPRPTGIARHPSPVAPLDAIASRNLAAILPVGPFVTSTSRQSTRTW
jgi:hypothetical protein